MSDEITWIVGVAFTLITVIGGIIARDRYILRLISKSHEDTVREAQRAADKLDDRLNRVKDDYVRRVDLDAHIGRLDNSVQSLTSEMRSSSAQTNQRLDAILAHFSKSIPTPSS